MKEQLHKEYIVCPLILYALFQVGDKTWHGYSFYIYNKRVDFPVPGPPRYKV